MATEVRGIGEVGDAWKSEFAAALLLWFDPRRCDFPWRRSTNAFYVAACEIMLQRTNAEKVDTAVRELMRLKPTASAVANARIEEIEQVLRPLGLPKRAGQIHAMAAQYTRAEMEGRDVTSDELRAMAGVGPYVYAAVSVFTRGETDALIDEHVLRILRRVFSIHAPARRHPTTALVQFARSLVPPGRAKEYNLAILDLGRLLCRPNAPKCSECPAGRSCDYARGGERD